MENDQNPKEEKRDKKTFPPKRLALVCCAGLLLIVLTVGLVFSLNRSEPEEPVPVFSPSPSPLPTVDPGIYTIDIYEGPRYLPRFDFPVNKLDIQQFSGEDGIISYSGAETELGVDVSEFQREIDWQAVKDAGVDFCILRAGYRGITEGVLSEDSMFEKNLEGAENAGLKIGVYFFSQAVSETEARREAEFVLERVEGHSLAYPVVFDWEPQFAGGETGEGEIRVAEMTGWQVTNFAKAFCERIKEGGYTPCFYANKNMCYNFLDLEKLKDFDFWYAEYQPVPSLYYGFRIWQFTESGSIPGIETSVDINLCFSPY